MGTREDREKTRRVPTGRLVRAITHREHLRPQLFTEPWWELLPPGPTGDSGPDPPLSETPAPSRSRSTPAPAQWMVGMCVRGCTSLGRREAPRSLWVQWGLPTGRATHLHLVMHGHWSTTPSRITGLPGARNCFLKCWRDGQRSRGTCLSDATSGTETPSFLAFCLKSKHSGNKCREVNATGAGHPRPQRESFPVTDDSSVGGLRGPCASSCSFRQHPDFSLGQLKCPFHQKGTHGFH